LFWILCVLGYWFFLSPNTYLNLAYDDQGSPYQAEKAWRGLSVSEDFKSFLFDNYSAQELAIRSFQDMFSYNFYRPIYDKVIFTEHKQFIIDTKNKTIGVHEQDSLKANELITKLVLLANQRENQKFQDSIKRNRKELIISRQHNQIIFDSLKSIYARFKDKSRIFNNSYLIKDTLDVLEETLANYVIQLKSIDNGLESDEKLTKTSHSVIELNGASFNKNVIRPNLLFLLIAWLVPLNVLWFLYHFLLNKVRL